MDSDFITTWQNDVKELLGEENSAIISDKLAELTVQNNLVQKTLENNQTQIDKLTENNTKLVNANAGLLQQIPIGFEEKEDKKDDEPLSKKTTFKEQFDKYGNFI